ncbi:MAG: hypothetical protein MZU97_04720 [Bacillus subtilis]|nr:hypothetical protein [Bacillus subtilis]
MIFFPLFSLVGSIQDPLATRRLLSARSPRWRLVFVGALDDFQLSRT